MHQVVHVASVAVQAPGALAAVSAPALGVAVLLVVCTCGEAFGAPDPLKAIREHIAAEREKAAMERAPMHLDGKCLHEGPHRP